MEAIRRAMTDYSFDGGDRVFFHGVVGSRAHAVDKAGERKLRNRLETFRAVTGARCAVHPAMVTPEGVLTRRSRRFSTRWNRLRDEQLLRDDVRDLSRVVELGQLSVLAELLRNRSGEQIVYRSLSGEVKADEKTVKSWVGVLKSLYYGFEVRPWFRNVENAIRKTPKWYLRDWARVADPGKRFETMVACHLLKAVEGWTDLGYGEFGLHYLRNKQKSEVDFLVSSDREPWFLVEAKTSDAAPTAALRDYQKAVGARHAFQVVLDAPFADFDCFAERGPVSVPALTLLSQLL